MECQVQIAARGHRQHAGVDFDKDKTFYATVKNPAQWAVLMHAAKKDWLIHHIDIKSAYFNVKLEGKTLTCMTPPLGYLKPTQKGIVLEILKCLYGLVQSGWGWYDELYGTFQKLGFTQSKIGHSVFIQWLVNQNEEIVITVTTDDMAVTRNTDQAVQRFKNEIKKIYNITDLGDLCWFLGMEIKCDHVAYTISINQKVYIKGMATKFWLMTAKPVYILILPSELLTHKKPPFTPTQHAKMSKIPYKNMIGHILWPVMISCPDTLFATRILLQFISNPRLAHTKALKWLTIYLYTTRDCWLTFCGKDVKIIAYMDTDYT